MGRRAFDETKQFEGSIDDFKIIKYPGGNKQEPPTIEGPTEGQPGEEYEYTFNSLDPDGDDIYLYIEWGDGDIEDYIGPYQSEEEVILKHTYTEEDTYIIRAKAKDLSGRQSEWSETLTVSMPRSINTINQLFQIILYQFPCLKYLFNQVSKIYHN